MTRLLSRRPSPLLWLLLLTLSAIASLARVLWSDLDEWRRR